MASLGVSLFRSFVTFLALLRSTGCHGDTLGMDKAGVNLINKLPFSVDVSSKSDNCYKCLDIILKTVHQETNRTIVADTTFGVTLYVNDSRTQEHICSTHHHLQERAIYRLTVSSIVDDLFNVSNVSCHFFMYESGINSYLPILYAAVAIIVISVAGVLVFVLYRYIFERCYFNAVDRVTARDLGMPKKTSVLGTGNGTFGRNSTSLNATLLTQGTAEGPTSTITPTSPSPTDHTPSTPPDERTPLINPRSTTAAAPVGREGTAGGQRKGRLTSLDTFRGLSLIIMIFVNYGGGGYYFFNHSRWNGVTVADLVFPWFVWIMGVSVVFSFKSRRKESFLARLYQVLRRSIILFALGLFLNNGYQLSQWRIPGVLQRFGITYFVVALTELLTVELYACCDHRQWFKWSPVADLTHCWVQWLLVAVLELLWLALTFLLPPSIEGCPR